MVWSRISKIVLVSLILSPLDLGLPYMDRAFPCLCTASSPRPFLSMHFGDVALTKASRITWSEANWPHKKSEARSALQVMAQPWNATEQPKRVLCAKWWRSTKITLLDGKRRNGTLKRNDKAIFAWPWNEDARTKQKQQTNENRAIWLVYRRDANARGFCLVKRTLGWKNFTPANFLESNRSFALTSYCNTIGQSNNAFPILGFSLAGKRRVNVLIFSFIVW